MLLCQLERYKIGQSVQVNYESAGGSEKIHTMGTIKDIGTNIQENLNKTKYVWISVWMPVYQKTSVFPSWCIH